MTMPDLTPANYTLKIGYKLEHCADQALAEIDLTAKGFAIRGGLKMLMGYSESRAAMGQGAVPAAFLNRTEPCDLELVSELYKTGTPLELWDEALLTLGTALHNAQTGIIDDTSVTYPRHKYLEVGVWSTSSYIDYRIPVEILGYELVPVWKTNMSVMQAVVRLRVVDPVWYGKGTVYYTWSVTNVPPSSGPPTGTQVVDGRGARRRVRRIVVKLIHLGTGNIINPTLINDKGETFTITGTLDTNGQYWQVDMIEGRCYEGTTYGDLVDVTGAKFSGDFIGIDKTSTDSLIVTGPTAGGAITYNAFCEFTNSYT